MLLMLMLLMTRTMMMIMIYDGDDYIYYKKLGQKYEHITRVTSTMQLNSF